MMRTGAEPFFRLSRLTHWVSPFRGQKPPIAWSVDTLGGDAGGIPARNRW